LYEEIFTWDFAKDMKEVKRRALEKCTSAGRENRRAKVENTARNDNTEKKIRCIMEVIKRKGKY